VIALRSRPVAAALLLLWTAVVWKLCTADHVPLGPRYPWSPWLWNLGHAPLFGLWAALVALVVKPGRVAGPAQRVGGNGAGRVWLLAASAGVLFGLLVEWRQAYIPGRTASALDVLTDAIGAFGVPWALATGALFSWRAVAVFVTAAAAALIATVW
jgi:hypothetical protein